MKMKTNVATRVTVLVSILLTTVCSFDLTLYPSTICYQEHDDVILRCVVSDHNTSNVKFQFKSRDRPDVVHELNSTSVSSSAVETRIPNVTIQNNVGTYFCCRDGYSKRQISYIEEKVVLPDDVLCYFHKSQGSMGSMTCEWMGDNSTCWNLSTISVGNGFYVNEQTCNVSMTCDEFSPLTNCIRARYRTKMKMTAVCPVSSKERRKIDLKLTGRKLTSSASKIIHKLMDCSKVKLQISDAQIQNVSGTWSVLVWRTTSSTEKDCDCQIQCVVKTSNPTHTTVSQRCSNASFFETVLRNLHETTLYSSVIRCTTVGSGIWSDEEDVNFTTTLEAPHGGHLVGPGGYNMYVCQERFYCLILYWRDTEGKVSKYQVSVSNKTNKFDFEVLNSPMGRLRIPMTRHCQQFDVTIYAVNSVGISGNGTLLRVKDQSRATCTHRSIACTYSESNDGYLVSTDVNNLCLETTGCDVTYFWCKGIRNASHVECENFVLWTKGERNESTTFISFQEKDRGLNSNVYIGISVSYHGQTTGIDWEACQNTVAAYMISRNASGSAKYIITSCVIVFIVAMVVIGCLCARRGRFKEKIQKILTRFSRENVSSVANFQLGHLTQHQSEANRRETSDPRQNTNPRDTQTPLVSIISGSIIHPRTVSVESSDHYQKLDFSSLLDSSRGSQTIPKSVTPDTPDAVQSHDSGYDNCNDSSRGSQTIPKSTHSITPVVNTSDAIQSQGSDDANFDDSSRGSQTMPKSMRSIVPDVYIDNSIQPQDWDHVNFDDSSRGSQTISKSIHTLTLDVNTSYVIESQDSDDVNFNDSSRGSQTIPKGTRSVTPDVNTSDATQSQISDYVSFNDLPIITGSGEAEMKTVRDDKEFGSFSNNNQACEKQKIEVHKCTDNSNETNNLNLMPEERRRNSEIILLENESENSDHCSLSLGYVRAEI